MWVGHGFFLVVGLFFLFHVEVEGAATDFISVWDVADVLTFFDDGYTTGYQYATNPVGMLQLPLKSTGSYNFVVDWGDGNQDTITTWDQAEAIHTYDTAAEYTVTISGEITGWMFYEPDDSDDNNKAQLYDAWKLKEIQQWGMYVCM